MIEFFEDVDFRKKKFLQFFGLEGVELDDFYSDDGVYVKGEILVI